MPWFLLLSSCFPNIKLEMDQETIRFGVSTTPFKEMWQLPQMDAFPKRVFFLVCRKGMQGILDPLVVSWGYETDPGFGSGSQYIDYHEWQGTRDLAAFLSVPTAIEYMTRSQWDEVRADCHQLAVYARQEINTLTGLPSICPEGKGWFGQMVCPSA